jgi:ubiquinone/menaquinone biosynthesis C-methylase UbiE
VSKSYAQKYDQTFSFFKDYSAEAIFIKQLIDAHHPETDCILDVACGTGSHLIELATMGYKGVALDIDQEILDIAQTKATERGVELETVQADMRNFQLSPPVSVAINMFYSFQNALDNEEDQICCLKSIRDSMEVGGLLIMELLPEENNLRQYPPEQFYLLHQEKYPDGTELFVSSRNEILDKYHKEIVFTYEKRKDDRCLTKEVIVSPLYRMYLEPTRKIFETIGLSIIAEYGAYSLNTPFSAESEKIIIVARKVAWS